MKSKLLSALDVLSAFSPLNPRNLFNPLRPLIVKRRPPGAIPETGHASLLAQFYGDKTSLDVVPFPNMEWWWQAIDVACGDRQFSVISNVQLFAVPLKGYVTQGTIAIRDKATGRSWEAHATGVLDPGTSAAFSASRWSIGYADAACERYVVDVGSPDLAIKLTLTHGATAFLGDPAANRGWYDLNPDGLVPLWASYRSRFSTDCTGTITVDGETLDVSQASARFDHQSLHLNPCDFGSYTLPALGEMALLSPQWRWYHATLETGLGPRFHVMACEVRNGNTDKVIKRAAALCDDAGGVALVDPKTLKFEPDASQGNLAGRVTAPKRVTIRFDIPAHVIDAPSGSFQLICQAQADRDWTVHYPIVGPLHYDAQEVPIEASGSAGRWDVRGTGTLEVLDMVRSVSVG